MSKVPRLEAATQRSEIILHKNGITSLPVDPFLIASKHDIVVKEKPDSAEGVSGMLLRHGNVFGILYATHIRSDGFQRFSIAHELGHYFLDGHVDHIIPTDGFHASNAGFVSRDSYELEADHFAAGLLMPSKLFRTALGRFIPGLAAIESLAELCLTSLTASAIRFAELSDSAVAVVLSTASTIDFCCLSERFKVLPDLAWPKRGIPIPRNTVTWKFHKNADRILRSDRDSGETDLTYWLSGRRSMTAFEEVVGLGGYGKTLTVLTCSSMDHDEDVDEEDDDDENIIERWTPRF